MIEYALEVLFTLVWSTAVFGLLLAADVTAHVSGHVFDLSVRHVGNLY